MDGIALTVLAQQIVLGLLLGGLYGLAAAGLSLVFGVLKVLDVAHGELIMLGGYGTYWLFTLLRLDPFASLLLVIPGMLVLGVVLYAVLFGFVITLHFYIGWLPLAFSVFILAFEVIIALFQAYIFTLLATIYLGEVIHLHA